MPIVLVIGILLAASPHSWGQAPPAETRALERAVAYLAEEVPHWSKENRCFSCHNNGDGARALYAAARKGMKVPEGALGDTTQWLLKPADWDTGPMNPAFADKKLGRIQFTAALSGAIEAGRVNDGAALRAAAESLLLFQEADGSWQVDRGVTVGSPVTYGPVLATYMARKSLEHAAAGTEAARFAEPIAKANNWLLAASPNSNLDRATLVMALPGDAPGRRRHVGALLSTQNSDGGWGPHAATPSEAFDTAIILLALAEWDEPEISRAAVSKGRAFLIARQLPSGGWPETTRPAGGQSYAQHISTTAWATLALLRTHAEPQ